MKPEPQTITEVKAAVEEAVSRMSEARRAGDLAGLRQATERKRRLERAGGFMLLKGLAAKNLGKFTAERWRSYAELTDEAFEKSLQQATKSRTIGTSCSQATTIVSDWAIEDGVMTRTVRGI